MPEGFDLAGARPDDGACCPNGSVSRAHASQQAAAQVERARSRFQGSAFGFQVGTGYEFRSGLAVEVSFSQYKVEDKGAPGKTTMQNLLMTFNWYWYVEAPPGGQSDACVRLSGGPAGRQTKGDRQWQEPAEVTARA